MNYRVLPQGRRVIVWRGPAKTTYYFDSDDDALDFAEQTEAELLAEAEARMATLERYADPDHPADPVLPHPAELARARAELDALKTGGEPPPPFDSSTIEPVGDDDAFREQARDAVLGGGTDPGLVTVDLEWDPDRDRVSATIHNEGEEAATVHREVLDEDGRVARKGDVTVEPGRQITRPYSLAVGQSIRFHADGVALASFEAETNTEPDPDE